MIYSVCSHTYSRDINPCNFFENAFIEFAFLVSTFAKSFLKPQNLLAIIFDANTGKFPIFFGL